MDDDVAGGFIVLVILVAFIGGVIWLSNSHTQNVDKDCKDRFGPSWVGKTPSYNPDFCVNTDGSVKYLQ